VPETAVPVAIAIRAVTRAGRPLVRAASSAAISVSLAT
jgi:hypothetical protein